MPQVLKDDVRERIVRAALATFARVGFQAAAMAAIAREAGVSTGNVYRYFPSKEALFEAVVTPGLVRAFLAGLRRRVESLRGVHDVRELPGEAPFYAASEDLLRFCLEHRPQVIALLGGAAGTRYADFRDQLEATLRALALAHFRHLEPALEVTPAMAFSLAEIYRHLVDTTLRILTELERDEDVRSAIAAYSRYHLAGLNALFSEPAAFAPTETAP